MKHCVDMLHVHVYNANPLLLHIPAENSWYCSDACCVLDGQREDKLRSYSQSVLWNGLLDLSHRDMIREADGLAMMAMWRLDMLRFWEANHYKYLIIGHRLLAGN